MSLAQSNVCSTTFIITDDEDEGDFVSTRPKANATTATATKGSALEEAKRSVDPPSEEGMVCPLCWKTLKGQSVGLSHIKCCGKGLPTKSLLQAMELHKKQVKEWESLGLKHPGLKAVKGGKGNRGAAMEAPVRKRKRAAVPDPDLEFALALSASLQEASVEKQKETHFLPEVKLSNQVPTQLPQTVNPDSRAPQPNQEPTLKPSMRIRFAKERKARLRNQFPTAVEELGLTTKRGKVDLQKMKLFTATEEERKESIAERVSECMEEAEKEAGVRREWWRFYASDVPLGVGPRLTPYVDKNSTLWKKSSMEEDPPSQFNDALLHGSDSEVEVMERSMEGLDADPFSTSPPHIPPQHPQGKEMEEAGAGGSMDVAMTTQRWDDSSFFATLPDEVLHSQNEEAIMGNGETAERIDCWTPIRDNDSFCSEIPSDFAEAKDMDSSPLSSPTILPLSPYAAPPRRRTANERKTMRRKLMSPEVPLERKELPLPTSIHPALGSSDEDAVDDEVMMRRTTVRETPSAISFGTTVWEHDSFLARIPNDFDLPISPLKGPYCSTPILPLSSPPPPMKTKIKALKQGKIMLPKKTQRTKKSPPTATQLEVHHCHDDGASTGRMGGRETSHRTFFGRSSSSQALTVDSSQTPMLNYSSIDTPILKAELKKYGLKPFPRSKAKVLLRHIYSETHKK